MGLRNRQGKDKKRRAGRYGKTKLKSKNFKRWDPNPKISDPDVKKMWDPSKSPSNNLASMGLCAKPNDLHASKKKYNLPTSVIELFDVPESDDLTNTSKPKRVMPLGEAEQRYIAQCIEKHGDNYKKMFMDLKVNNMHHTETQLRKMASRFLLLESSQRVVDVPNKVAHLVGIESS